MVAKGVEFLDNNNDHDLNVSPVLISAPQWLHAMIRQRGIEPDQIKLGELRDILRFAEEQGEQVKAEVHDWLFID